MATVTKKSAVSRGGSIDVNGARNITVRYICKFNSVEVAAGDNTVENAILAMDALIKPQTTPSMYAGINSLGETVYATYYGSKSWSWSTDDRACIFDLTYTSSPSGESNMSLIETSGNTSGTTRDVYRVGFDSPSGGFGNPSQDDIGGTLVDSGGTPTSIVGVDRRFSTTEKVSDFPDLDAYDYIVGYRNAQPYEGGGVGSILYLGFSWGYDTNSGLWALTHQFSVDKFTYHARQVAKTDPNGEVLKAKTGNVYTAKHVYFVQPFGLASFIGLPDF